MNIYHLSHIDLDGYTCQLVTRNISTNIHYYNANYGAEVTFCINEIITCINNKKEDALLLITDLNLSINECDILEKAQKTLQQSHINLQLQVLDHHGSGRDSAAIYDWYYLDTTRSATKITFDYINKHYPDSLNQQTKQWLEPLVTVVNASDLWLQNEKEAFEYGKVCAHLIHT
jgi:oligoribonuclease NrnB/cAMP/cGMP phosphodiesterase (DHH superfamily)